MTTYAPVPAFAARKRHPSAMLVIIGGHAALLGAVMTVQMDLPVRWTPILTKVKLIPEPSDPPPAPPPRHEPQRRSQSRIDQMPRIVPIPQPNLPSVNRTPLPQPNPGPLIGSGMQPKADPLPKPAPVRTGPHFITPDRDLKPPYPQQKLRMEEEAVLRLKLAIDSTGRVTAVEPVGSADPAFLAAARRHLIAKWRYTPATEDGQPIASSTVITLRFQLE